MIRTHRYSSLFVTISNTRFEVLLDVLTRGLPIRGLLLSPVGYLRSGPVIAHGLKLRDHRIAQKTLVFIQSHRNRDRLVLKEITGAACYLCGH